MTLVDSDVLIWLARGSMKAAAALDAVEDIGVSAVSYMELLQGVRSKAEIRALRALLADLQAEILPLTEAISLRATVLLETHRPAHRLMMADALVAATAVQHGAVLLTANTKHFKPVDGLQMLTFKP